MHGTLAAHVFAVLAGGGSGVAPAQAVIPALALFPFGRTAPGASAVGAHRLLAFVVITLAAWSVFAAAAKLGDLYRTRETARVALRATVADALVGQRDPVTPIVYVPLWTVSPATIDLTGSVTSVSRRHTVLRRVADAAAHVRRDVAIRNRLILIEAPQLDRRAAGRNGRRHRHGVGPAQPDRPAVSAMLVSGVKGYEID